MRNQDLSSRVGLAGKSLDSNDVSAVISLDLLLLNRSLAWVLGLEDLVKLLKLSCVSNAMVEGIGV